MKIPYMSLAVVFCTLVLPMAQFYFFDIVSIALIRNCYFSNLKSGYIATYFNGLSANGNIFLVSHSSIIHTMKIPVQEFSPFYLKHTQETPETIRIQI